MIQKPEMIDGMRLRTQVIIYLSCMCMCVHVVAVYVCGSVKDSFQESISLFPPLSQGSIPGSWI